MFKENLPKRDPRLENFGPKNPPILAAHTCTLNMLCYPPGEHLSSTTDVVWRLFSRVEVVQCDIGITSCCWWDNRQ